MAAGDQPGRVNEGSQELQNWNSEVSSLHSAIVEARAQASRLNMPFVAYLLGLAVAALKEDCAEG